MEARAGHRIRLLQLAQRIRVPAGLLLAPLLVIAARPSIRTILVGSLIALIGLTLRAWASGCLRKNLQLAVGGPYAYTRNPLYLGTFIMGAGIATASGSWWFFALYITLYFLVYTPVMFAEAETMERLFNREYAEYRRHVPLFFPRMTPYSPSEKAEVATKPSFAISQYVKHREYRAALGVLAVVAILLAKCFFGVLAF